VLARALGLGFHVVEEGLCGRTTSFDDPQWGLRNGRLGVAAVIETHLPIDTLVLDLGTNDLKARFKLSAADIALGLESLINEVRVVCRQLQVSAPEMIIVSPAPVLPASTELDSFVGADERGGRLTEFYRAVAARQGCRLFEAGAVVSSSPIDSVHWDAQSHGLFGAALARFLRDGMCADR